MSDNDADQLRPGVVLRERFKLRRLIATTTLNAVYYADDLVARRPVVVKLLLADPPPRGLPRPSAIRMFAAEAALLGALGHPQVPRLVAAFRERGTYCLVMQYVAGTPLDQLLDSGLLTPDGALAIARSLCRVVGDLHRAGVVHADIKPNNIIVQPGGRAALLDFGLARRAGQPPAFAEVLGTPPYAPPEQWAGAPLDARSDVYALGQLLGELFIVAGCPNLRAALAPALAADSEQRFADVPALRRALAAALPPAPLPPERPPMLWDAWAFAGLLLLLFALAVLLLRLCC